MSSPAPVSPLRIAITGANRGLGLGLARAYAEEGHTVLALARNPGPGLNGLADQHPNRVWVHPCDVADADSVARAAGSVADRVPGLDLLINNAGITGSREGELGSLDLEGMHEVFEVNVVGPLRVTESLLPLLRQGASPRIVNITSRMGSIADNTSGGAWAYRISKAALNMASRNLMLSCRELGIATMVMHPGWVQTDMGGDHAPLTISESVAGMRRVIADLDMDSTGAFRDFSGADLPW